MNLSDTLPTSITYLVMQLFLTLHLLRSAELMAEACTCTNISEQGQEQVQGQDFLENP